MTVLEGIGAAALGTALAADVTRAGWLATAAAYVTIMAVAVILLDEMIGTGLALRAGASRQVVLRRAVTLVSAAAVAAVVALSALVSPPLESAPAQPPLSFAAPGLPAFVVFVISGDAPAVADGDEIAIDYGSGLHIGQAAPAQINGTITYQVPFSPSARSYFVSVAILMAGHLTCKVVLVRPYPRMPATISSAAGSGEHATCLAIAVPGPGGWPGRAGPTRHPAAAVNLVPGPPSQAAPSTTTMAGPGGSRRPAPQRSSAGKGQRPGEQGCPAAAALTRVVRTTARRAARIVPEP